MKITPKEAAVMMARYRTVTDAFARGEAEKMFGCKFDNMTKEQRVLAAEVVSAFFNEIIQPFEPTRG